MWLVYKRWAKLSRSKENKEGVVVSFLKYLLITICLISTGCAAPHKYAQVMPKINAGNDYTAGEIKTKSVGDVMLANFNTKEMPAFEAAQDIKIPQSLGLNLDVIRTGSSCKIEAQYDNGLYFCHMNPPIMNDAALIRGFNMCLLVAESGEIKNISWCHTPGDSIMSDPYSGLFLKRAKHYAAGSFRSELVYNGRSRETIKLLYREYLDNMARPAFSQELLYDLSESKKIGFKDMLIDVIEAKNTGITFKIVK
jgi:hypothetical protein